MLTLLLTVIICGIIAWVINTLHVPQPYQVIAQAILLIICVVIFFQEVLGVSTPLLR